MSTIAVVKVSIGYQSAGNRPSCSNCKHGDEGLLGRIPLWRCKKNGFKTTAMSVCREHAIKPTPGATPP